MPKQPEAINQLPAAAAVQMRLLGEHLALARKRRREPRRLWAARLGVSEPTLARLERGDPGVSFGVVATALWLMGRVQALGELAAPQHDAGALEDAVRAAAVRSVRKRASVSARLQEPVKAE